jgi:ribosomal protein S18 acetylase RimI-like enzyme
MTSCTDTEFQQIEELVGVLSSSCKANRDIIDEVLAKEDSHLFVARDADGRIVGMTTICCFTIPTGRHATIEDVVVLPECQGMGLGRKLLQYALQYLKDTGLSYKVSLTSKPARIAANALYRSMSFKLKETNVYTLDVVSV